MWSVEFAVRTLLSRSRKFGRHFCAEIFIFFDNYDYLATEMFKKSNLFILCFLANSLVGYAKTLTTSWVALRILAIMRNMRSTKNNTPMKKYILAILLMLCTNAYTFGQSKQHCHVDINYHLVFKKTYASFSENSICFSVHDDDSNAKMRRIEIEDTATIRHYWNIISKLFIDKTVKAVNYKLEWRRSKQPILNIIVYGDNCSREEYEYKIDPLYHLYPEYSGYSDEFIDLLSFIQTVERKLRQMKK